MKTVLSFFRCVIFFFALLSISNISGLKILLFTWKFPHFTRPFVMDDIINLKRKGHDVWIYSQVKPYPNVPKQESFQSNKLDKLTFYQEDNNTAKFIRDNEFDIFLTENGTSGYTALRVKERYEKHKTKVVPIFRGPDLSFQIKQNSHFFDNLFEQVDLIVPVSKYMCNQIKELSLKNHRSCAPLKFFWQGVQLNRCILKNYESSSQNLKVITVARLHKMKGLNFAVRAFKEIADKYENVKYLIVGDGPEKGRLLRLIQELDLIEKVEILGGKKQEDVMKLLSVSDIFLHPNISIEGYEDGIPNSIMEAMGTGLPVISSWVVGIQELVEHNVTGFLAKQRNVKGIACYLEELVKDPDKRKLFGLNGRRKVEKDFNRDYWDQFLSDTLETLVFEGKIQSDF